MRARGVAGRGIEPKRVMTTAEGRQSQEEILLGVAFSSGLEEVVIPFFDRGLPVEYEVTRSIRVVGSRLDSLDPHAHESVSARG